VTGFQLNKGFLAGVGVAEVVSAEGEAVDAAVVFLDLGSFGIEGDAVVAGDGVAAADAVFRVWGFAGEGDTVPAGVVLGVTVTLRLRPGAGKGDAVLVGAGLSAAASF
jgi:hypothetical protein